MKKIICLAVSLLALMLTPVFGQPTVQPPTIFAQRLNNIINPAPPPAPVPVLTRFNLDFPGGTPKDLVAAIEKATGKPLNVIIPDEDADTKLPPLKMDNVVVPQLFTTLEVASHKTASIYNPTYSNYQNYDTSYGFKSADNGTDNSIWFFYVQTPPVAATTPIKVCRYYPLAAYLNNGLTVDDITTAIQTGWKMEGADPLPELNYHKETKLLIAYGEPEKLQAIDDVLKALQQSTQNPNVHFGQRLNTMINKIPQPAGAPGQLGGNSSLSPEAQTLLIEKNRQAGSGSTNPSTPLLPELQNPPAENSTQ